MAVSLETRVPLLDHRVVEFAWRVPIDMQDPRRPDASGCCAQVLYRHVPARADRAAEDGLRGSHRRVAAGAAARLGGGAARDGRLSDDGYSSARADPPHVAGASRGQRRRALPAVDRADVPELARRTRAAIRGRPRGNSVSAASATGRGRSADPIGPRPRENRREGRPSFAHPVATFGAFGSTGRSGPGFQTNV